MQKIKTEKEGERYRYPQFLFLQCFLTLQSAKGGEYWQNVHISKSQIKTVGLCGVSAVLDRTICMNYLISLFFLHKLNAPTFSFKLSLHNKMNCKIHANTLKIFSYIELYLIANKNNISGKREITDKRRKLYVLILVFEQESSHFHFSLSPINFLTCLIWSLYSHEETRQ